MKKIIFTILSVLWMALIFMFSSAPADKSSEVSMSAGRVIADVFIPEFDDWSDARQEEFAKRIDYPVRKCAHASEYAVLGFLLVHAFQRYNEDGRKRSKNGSCDKETYYRSAITGVAYAASDEFHQLFVPGRAGRITDVMIDSMGLGAGILFAYILLALYEWKRQNRVKSHEKRVKNK